MKEEVKAKMEEKVSRGRRKRARKGKKDHF